jgi:ABC-type Co2+ transport system permease subunit
LGWIGIALALIAAIILDKGNTPHKWHAAIVWTFAAFFGVLIFGRKKRGSWLFWIFWATCLILHVLAMWAIFARLLPHLVLGTLYVIPLAFVESILLVGVFSNMERKRERFHSPRADSRSRP